MAFRGQSTKYKCLENFALYGRPPPGTDVANNSEGQYEPIKKNDEDDQYEPLSFGGGGASQEEGAYQPLSFQREDDNTYETTTTRT